MSEQSEKLVKIILPDLLNYLEMVESGEIIERRIKKNSYFAQRGQRDQFTVDKPE
ncbi:MAG: hypothetical protein ILP11_00475 [Alphaproteobacteria bacterium]|nr:hypothetical protein [Alphaproteobacteria bacterium]